MPPWSWPGAVALVVATLTSLGWSGALIITALPITDPITAGGANLLATVGGVLVGGVAGYLGAVAADISDRRGQDESVDPAPDDPQGGRPDRGGPAG